MTTVVFVARRGGRSLTAHARSFWGTMSGQGLASAGLDECICQGGRVRDAADAQMTIRVEDRRGAGRVGEA